MWLALWVLRCAGRVGWEERGERGGGGSEWGTREGRGLDGGGGREGGPEYDVIFFICPHHASSSLLVACQWL